VNTERRSIRSYVMRAGRITQAQKRALAELSPRYGIPFEPRPIDLDAVFGRRAPRLLEIGFGNGDMLVELASASPATDFIGVEVHPPGVGHCLLAVSERGLANVRVVMHDAVEVLEQMVPPAALDEVLLYFPDPWPKKRHHKRRLVQPEFAALVASRLKPGGRFKLATDWEPYAAWMLEVLNASPELSNVATDGGCVERPERSATRFERRGRKLGHRVFDLEFEKKGTLPFSSPQP
jgi:tRNA (guanine-N7-)-methyltransferase